LHQGGIREWNGRHEYCIAKQDFEAKNDMTCAQQNMTKAKFIQVIPTESKTKFTEPDDYGNRAETAGLQRLLQDNNYAISRIDGQAGKRTSRTLGKFLKDNYLLSSISIDAKYAALEKRVRETKKTVGVRFCNKSTARIWTALAYRNEYGYEARGWWPVEINKCIQPFAESLIGRDVHYYARQEVVLSDTAQRTRGSRKPVDSILKVPAGTGKTFCISPSVFSAIRHEFCQDQGYIGASFKAVPSEKPGTQIDLRDDNFNVAIVNELRQ